MSIENMFKKVRANLGEKTGGKQIPWELSSLQGDFFFVPISGESKAAVNTLEEENQRLEAERRRLEQERLDLARQKEELERRKALDEEREQLAAERKKIEAERQKLAMGPRPPTTGPSETGRDGPFIAYSNGPVLDTRTNLIWASRDNGSDINWADAKSYCENYRGGGYSDWQMPTQDELAGLYDEGKTQGAGPLSSYPLHLTELIDLTDCCPWTSERLSSRAATFSFNNAIRFWDLQSNVCSLRALPVRSGK